jgi:HSP20 family molecular chaperone IbpA
VSASSARNLPVLAEIQELAARIRKRAYELFADREAGNSQDFQDWLMAEREFAWPVAELVESKGQFELDIALAGFSPRDVKVTATPREVFVKAARESGRKKASAADRSVCWSEFRSTETCRQFAFPEDIDVRKVSAELENGMLKIVAPKAAKEKPEKGAKRKTQKKVGRKKSA